jgi:hypothetical protein
MSRSKKACLLPLNITIIPKKISDRKGIPASALIIERAVAKTPGRESCQELTGFI